MKKYIEEVKAKGVVFGNFWGGGSGYYPSETIYANTMDELKSKINSAYKSGGLDSGMGYESLTGYALDVCITYAIEINGKKYHRKEYETLTEGDADEEMLYASCE